jgi:lipoprotein-anchoring transpeptidase ErfK/SrfK
LQFVRAALGLFCFAFLWLPAASAESKEETLRRNVAWQLALERVMISPGIIDGKVGPKTELATKEFQRVHGLPQTGKLDEATSRKLKLEPENVFWRYKVTKEHLDQIGPAPRDWVARSKLDRLAHPTLEDVFVEEFHCTKELLRLVNPGRDLNKLKPGDKFVAILKVKPRRFVQAKYLEVNLKEKVIRVIDKENELAALFHCSIAANKNKRPSGEARITRVVTNPEYTFDPDMWPEVDQDIDRKLRIPPGPKNPVGRCWIELSLRGYGIHGTPDPEMIGKTGSHGCFRMTNWDALALARMVDPGVEVRFVAREQAG